MASKREITIYIQLRPMPQPDYGYVSATLVTTGKRYKVTTDYGEYDTTEAYIRGIESVVNTLKQPNIIHFHCDDSNFMSELLQSRAMGIREDIRGYYRKLWETLLLLLVDHELSLYFEHNSYFEGMALNEATKYAKALEDISRADVEVIQLPTEQEALELAKANKWNIVDLIVKDFGVILYYKKSKHDEPHEIKEQTYAICSITSNGRIYVSKDGRYTFNQSEAKRMSIGEAKSKAAGMTRSSRKGYKWNALKL